MKISDLLAGLLLAFVVLALPPVTLAEEKTMDCDWCSITYPEKVEPDAIFSVKVTPKKIPSGMKIGGDLHKAKPGTYLGFAAWGGDPKPAKTGETLTFRYRMPAFESEDLGAQPIYFLTTKGWDEATLKAFGPVILPDLTENFLKTRRPATATLKKSWLCFGAPRSESGGKPRWKSGEKIVIPVEYYVDPSDDWGETKIVTWVLGPWVDCPDGKYVKNRKHLPSNCGISDTVCEVGKRVQTTWTLTLPKANSEAGPEKGKLGDGLLLVSQFKGADGKNWPWQLRMGLPAFERDGGFFDLDAPTPGNLFTYDQPVVMNVIPTEKGQALPPSKLTWKVTDTLGKTVLSGSESFPPQNGKTLELPLKLTQKGTFLLRAELPGKESREITFARIPDLKPVIGNGPTRFGGQKFFGDAEAARAARLLGMSTCRVWLNWQNLEPARGIFNEPAIKALHENVKVLRQNHIRPWFLLDGIPAWAINAPETYAGSFTALPIPDSDVERFVTRISQEFKNEIIGFEWQNEIVPGNVCADPVAEYVRFCRTADAASKKVNPKFQNQIAGGLWPQTYRQSLIAAGIMEFTDILSVHYGTDGAVRGAKRDLAVVGAENRVLLWDDETACGASTWGMPLSEAMRETAQSDYFFARFPGELMAGCEQIVLFGGEASAAGDWSHFWSDHSPRPAAAALAVLVHALADAQPVGEFSVGKNDSMKLFERPGRPPVLVVSSIEKGGETVRLPVGKARVTRIDQQGNETEIPHTGTVSLRLNESAFLVEGGTPNVLKANLVLSFPGTASGTPTFTAIAGNSLEIPLRFTNFLDLPIDCTVTPDADLPGKAEKVAITKLAPGKSVSAILKVDSVKAGQTAAALTLKFADAALPAITRKIIINAVQPGEIGNLLRNPGFEEPESPQKPNAAASWNCPQGKRTEFRDPDALGHGNFVYQFEKTGSQYFSIFQNVPKLPTVGGEYVYSFWIRSENLATGSNLGGTTTDGQSWNRHWLQIFQSPKNQPEWQVFTKRVELPAGTKSLSAAPVCQGDGWAMIDNSQLVPYEGTEFVAFAPKAGKIRIDGKTDDFNRSAPIPLIGRNQLRVLNEKYAWSPKNASAVAYFNYDSDFLYAAIEVLDDQHSATQTEANCRLEDSVRIAIRPTNRLPGEESKAFCLDLSSAQPGGSGKHTIYRPKEFSGGLKSGSLAKDSSVYDVAIHRDGNRTIYEIAMPWSDLGGPKGIIGTKIGLSLQLTDCDRASRGPEALLLWGEGLFPAWSPASFGMLTLTE